MAKNSPGRLWSSLKEQQIHTGSQEGVLFLLVVLTRKLRKAEAIPLG